MSSFSSTPTFSLFQRGLEPRIVRRFHGLNAYTPLTQLGQDWAQDLLNVIVNSNGQLSKFRLPQQLSAPSAFGTGPQFLFDFQQASGVRQIFTSIGTSLAYFTNDGATGPIVVSAASPQNANPWSFVEVANILIGVNGLRTVKWTGTDLLNVGIQIPLVAPTVVVVAGGLSPAFGYEWAYSWKSSGNAPGLAGPSPVEVSTASPATAQIDGGGANHSYQLTATIPAPPDPQFDTLVWWRTIDGGGDLFRLAEVNINTGAVTFNGATVTALGAIPYIKITDNTPDLSLDQTTRAPFLNAPPIQGKFAAVGQGRVFIANLTGAPQDIIYSGYERIIIGNPPECYPPNNRLRLSIGAEAVAGVGILQAGVVAFSNTDKMYMLRGQVEDITDTAPVQFTQYLEELPWKIGCFSHATIQATPYGLVWLAGDKTVQLFDGHSQIQDISSPVYPILRTITAGAEAACVSAYFNWLERDWYVLLVPTGGALTPNKSIWWALDKETSSIDIFVSTIPADGIGVVTSSQLQRRLLIGRTGQLFNMPISSDTTNGIADLSLIPAAVAQPFIAAVNGSLAWDQAVTAFGTGTAVATGAITPGVTPAWGLLLITEGGAAPTPTGGWSNYGVTTHPYALAQYLATATPVTGTATIPNGNWCAAFLTFGVVGNAIPTLVQNNTFLSGAWNTAQTSNFVNPLVAGNTLIIMIDSTTVSTVTGMAVTDTAGNVYTKRAHISGTNCQLDVWVATNVLAGSPTINLAAPVGGPITGANWRGFEIQGGVAGQQQVIAQLQAYWRSGYFGNDSPQRMEMWRWLRLLTDQDPAAFKATLRLVDDDKFPVSAPNIVMQAKLKSSRLSINQRAKRVSVEINFPVADVSSNVMELQVHSIPSADR